MMDEMEQNGWKNVCYRDKKWRRWKVWINHSLHLWLVNGWRGLLVVAKPASLQSRIDTKYKSITKSWCFFYGLSHPAVDKEVRIIPTFASCTISNAYTFMHQ